MMAAPRISSPPMVGVPALAPWLRGPSLRTTWLICSRRSDRITHGPNTSENKKAVQLAATVRNVMYCVTLSSDTYECNGYSRWYSITRARS